MCRKIINNYKINICLPLYRYNNSAIYQGCITFFLNQIFLNISFRNTNIIKKAQYKN